MRDFLPVAAHLETIVHDVPDHRLFRFRPEAPLAVAPGQFVEISLPGIGTFPVSASTWPTVPAVESCIRKAGRVTEALYGLPVGVQVGLRGPFGNGFPLPAFSGHDVLLIAGGLGMAPLRALLHWFLPRRADFGAITLLYGSREPAQLLFRRELEGLAASGAIALRLAVDLLDERLERDASQPLRLGTVRDLLDGLDFDPARTVAALCGPPALYTAMLEPLAARGIPSERIHATLERRMRCGIGQCCHCVTGGVYVCCSGPVFSLDALRQMEGAI